MASTDLRKSPSGELVQEVASFSNEWRDFVGQISDGDRVAALTTEVYRDTPFLMSFFQNNQNDELHFIHQINHDFKVNGALSEQVKFHLHCIPMVAPAAPPEVVVLDGYLYWLVRDQELPVLASWTSFRKTFNVVAADAFKLKLFDIGTITVPSTAAASDMVIVYLRRPALADAADTYSTNKVGGTPQANLALVSADLHYRISRFGTTTELGI